MDPSHLQSFLKVYDCGSVLKACALLNISQPALSRRLKRLEDVLQVQLFERTPTGLVPTAFGHALAARARLIGTEIDLARREIERLRNAVGGWVSFGANPGVAGSLLPAVARDLRRTNPELRLTVVEGVSDTLVGAVREGRLEFAVCTAPLVPGDGDMMFDHIAEDRFVIAADDAHPLAAGDAGAVPLAETLRFPWAMATFTGFVRQWFESSFLSAGLMPPVPQVETSSMIFLKQLLRGDDYLSILPVRLIENDFPGIARIRCRPDFLLTRSIAAARLRHRELSPAGQLVVDTFKRLSV
jgi:DNA-binding transcriptional LysR family regulator